ncbi:hypothetical protein Poly21_18350 [Allorhodopirellula heiligendammensis]|uniref:Uncharacterized protein n=1 Tax=Allorhodopirellula heiligendammensis TaxID=2714739 RepID=A0A5C6C4W5_9BACT|nr:hypothetical protein Poly21_18350 [Allorhodopirellula heiligendammensis]
MWCGSMVAFSRGRRARPRVSWGKRAVAVWAGYAPAKTRGASRRLNRGTIAFLSRLVRHDCGAVSHCCSSQASRRADFAGGRPIFTVKLVVGFALTHLEVWVAPSSLPFFPHSSSPHVVIEQRRFGGRRFFGHRLRRHGQRSAFPGGSGNELSMLPSAISRDYAGNFISDRRLMFLAEGCRP